MVAIHLGELFTDRLVIQFPFLVLRNGAKSFITHRTTIETLQKWGSLFHPQYYDGDSNIYVFQYMVEWIRYSKLEEGNEFTKYTL